LDEGKGKENLIQELRVLRDKLSQYDTQSKIDANRYEIMAEDAPLMIFAHRERFIYVNKTAALFSGYTKKELYGMNFWDIIHPDFQDIVKARGFKHLNGERVPAYYEIKIITKNDEERWLACASKHVDDFKGAPAVIASAIDVTDKKKAERELKIQKNYFKSLFDNSPSAIALLDNEDRVVQINKSFHELFKYYSIEVKGKNIQDFIVPKYLKEEDSSIVRGRDIKIRYSNGGQRWQPNRCARKRRTYYRRREDYWCVCFM
jgi:PAS domain S-box-containing protein